MDPESSLNNLQSQKQSPHKDDAEHLDIKAIKERFLNALKEVARLERIIEEKNTQLAVAAEEKDRLLRSLDKAFGKERQLHDKIADFDIVRNMELLEAREEIKFLTNEINRLNKESGDLIEEVFKEDKTIEELRRIPEGKEPEHGEAEAKLYLSDEDMEEIEAGYKDPAGYKALEKERDELKEKFIMATSELAQKAEIESEYLGRLEEFKKTISGLTTKLDEKIKENSSLKDEIAELGSLLDENKQAVNKSINERASLDENIQSKEREIKELNERHDSALKLSVSEIEKLNVQKTELEAGMRETERRSNEFIGELSSKDRLISELKEQADKNISGYQAEIEGLKAENDALNLKFAGVQSEVREEAAPIAKASTEEPSTGEDEMGLMPPQEKEQIMPAGNKAITEQKMIYMEHSGTGIMRWVALGIAVFIISGLAWYIFIR